MIPCLRPHVDDRVPTHVLSQGLNPTRLAIACTGYPNSGCSCGRHRRRQVHPLSTYDRPRVIPVRARTAATGYPRLCKWPTLDVGQLCKGPRRTTVTTHRRHHHCHLPPAPVTGVSVPHCSPSSSSSSSSVRSDFGHIRLRPKRIATTSQR